MQIKILFSILLLVGCSIAQMGGGPAEDGAGGNGPASGGRSAVVSNTCTPRKEIWLVDQAASRKNNVNDPNNTTAVSGGILYIYTPESLAAGRWDDVVDLYVEARESNCGVSKAPHMVRPNVANTHVVVPYTKGSWIHILSVATRKMVGCLSLAGGEAGIHNTTGAMHDVLIYSDDTFLLVADMGGFIHKVATDFAINKYTLVETLPLAPFKPALNPANALPAPRPISFGQVTGGKLVYVTLASGGVIVLDPGKVNTRMQIKKLYNITEVPQIGGLWAYGLPDGRVALNHGVVNPALNDYLHIFDGLAAEADEFLPPESLVLPGTDTHGLDYCVTPEGKIYLINIFRETGELYIIDPDGPNIVVASSYYTDFLEIIMTDYIYLDRSDQGHTGYLTVRGKVPLTGGVSNNSSRVPGILSIHLSPDCKTVSWQARDFIPVLEDLTVEGADPHGINLVQIKCPDAGSVGSSKSKTDVNARSFGVGVGATVFVLFFVLLLLSVFRKNIRESLNGESEVASSESKSSVNETKRSSDSNPSEKEEVELDNVKGTQ